MTFATGNGWAMHLGDCVELMPSFENVDHVITDPPYEAEAHKKARRALVDGTQKRGGKNAGKVRRIDQPLEISFPAITDDERIEVGMWLGALARRWVLVFCQAEALGAWRSALTPLDWVRSGVWIKPNGAPQFTGDRPGQGHESIAIAHRPGIKRWNGGGRHGVWNVPLDHHAGGGGKNDHPTTKPIALMLELVTDFTDPGEIILDPFAGSGTTGVACLRTGRRFIGVERDPRFFALACERLRAEEQGTTLQAARAGQTALFGEVG